MQIVFIGKRKNKIVAGFNELKEPIQFIKHADQKKEVTECANYKGK